MFLRVDFHENPNVGVYCRATDSIAFLRRGLSKKILQGLSETLSVDLVELSIADTSIIGSLLVANSHGIVATDLVDKPNIAVLNQQGFDVCVVSDVLNSALISGTNTQPGARPAADRQQKEVEHPTGRQSHG